ncbi:MAG: 16S rRNA (cytosine(1402)-N(4))-methyltransferase RsmH [bacterium]
MESVHKSVLLNETIEGLNLKDGATVVDATFGGGGHSVEICRRYKKVKIVAIDQDKGAWEKAKSKFKNCDCEINFINKNFADLGGLENVDGIIFDLGLSSDQLDNSGRGFSFMKNEALLMTMKENPSPEDITALDIVNTWSEKSLADIIYGYGEEKYRGRIAREIVENRKKKKIETTFDLVKIIEQAVPGSYKKGKIHFATRTFQALRIAVNDELGVLEKGLEQGLKLLKIEGRMAVISFHSLEDRIAKRFFKLKQKEEKIKLINKKPITASKEELISNNRSRSAKLRILEKIKI